MHKGRPNVHEKSTWQDGLLDNPRAAKPLPLEEAREGDPFLPRDVGDTCLGILFFVFPAVRFNLAFLKLL